jgi:hypothetical protein
MRETRLLDPERLKMAVARAAVADDALRAEEEAFWQSDPLMGAAEADDAVRAHDEFIREDAMDVAEAVGLGLVRPQDALAVAPGVAARLLRMRAARAPQLPRRNLGRAPRRVVHVSRRRRQAVARAGPRSDDPDEPDPPLGGSVEAGGLPPICPRCRSAVNVRRVSWVRGWSCRWCAFVNWRRRRELDAARVLAEAERTTRRAA